MPRTPLVEYAPSGARPKKGLFLTRLHLHVIQCPMGCHCHALPSYKFVVSDSAPAHKSLNPQTRRSANWNLGVSWIELPCNDTPSSRRSRDFCESARPQRPELSPTNSRISHVWARGRFRGKGCGKVEISEEKRRLRLLFKREGMKRKKALVSASVRTALQWRGRGRQCDSKD